MFVLNWTNFGELATAFFFSQSHYCRASYYTCLDDITNEALFSQCVMTDNNIDIKKFVYVE